VVARARTRSGASTASAHAPRDPAGGRTRVPPGPWALPWVRPASGENSAPRRRRAISRPSSQVALSWLTAPGHPRRGSVGDDARRQVVEHQRCGPDDGVVADGHAVDHVGAEADRGSGADADRTARRGAGPEAGVVADDAVVVDGSVDAEQHAAP